ncbi:MAG: N-acetyl-gamma-glutamyl-phosphate reductase [Bacteroidetes bacterium]|nr:N-acetyl-gamma-glutamyl-phosphate reductase [Bacteroidota bacterium]
MNKIRIAIEGGAGYTAGELIRLLINHPFAKIKYIHSQSNAGKPVSSIHRDLLGETDLIFNDIDFSDSDVLFLCKGHNQSVLFLNENLLPDTLKIIDLSQDYRDESHAFVYGLPELQQTRITTAKKIANPGCFATTIELALLPLAFNNILNGEIHITAITGSTGAGQAPTESSHFSWRNNNISVYKPFRHQHLKEIKMVLKMVQADFKSAINLIPMRGNFTRGIFASLYVDCNQDLSAIKSYYESYYSNHPFVIISNEMPDLKQVVNTNKCIIYLEKFDNKLYIISMIDNLIKGASGQAVQNMNLMFGLPQDTGLHLKPVAF